MPLRNLKTIESHAVDGGNLILREETLSDGSLAYSIEGYKVVKHNLVQIFEITCSGLGNSATIWNAIINATDIRLTNLEEINA